MDIRKVKKLIELLEASDIAEIEIKEGEESVRISRGSSSVQQQALTYQLPQQVAPAPIAAPADSNILPNGQDGRRQGLCASGLRRILRWRAQLQPLMDVCSYAVESIAKASPCPAGGRMR